MDYHTDIPEIDGAIDARMEILSPTVRHLLRGEAVPTLASALAAQHNLTEEMRSGLEKEIALVLMYMEPVDSFASNLMMEYLVPPEAASEIEKEVAQKLFAPILNELGHSSEQVEGETAPTTPTAVHPPVQTISVTPTPPPTSHVPVARVMPQSKADIPPDPRTSTELPNALLQNLKASLMHSAPEEPFEGTNPAPSYNAILDPKPPVPPQS